MSRNIVTLLHLHCQIRLLPMNNFHLPYHNHWQTLWPPYFTRRLLPSKIFFQISPPSPLPKYLSYFSQFQANHHRSTISKYNSPKSCTDTFSILISHLANLSFTHATSLSKFKLLSELHWLPVRHRINFKIATITFKGSPVPAAILSRRLLFHGKCQHDRCDLLLQCHYVFLIEKPEWQSPNHFHLLPRVFGINRSSFIHFHSSRFQEETQAPSV